MTRKNVVLTIDATRYAIGRSFCFAKSMISTMLDVMQAAKNKAKASQGLEKISMRKLILRY